MQDERIVCAAIKHINTGIIVPSVRHFDNLTHDLCEKIWLGYKGSHFQQGFVNQRGEFRSREEALIVAKNAGQLDGRTKSGNPHSKELFSEDLY